MGEFRAIGCSQVGLFCCGSAVGPTAAASSVTTGKYRLRGLETEGSGRLHDSVLLHCH